MEGGGGGGAGGAPAAPPGLDQAGMEAVLANHERIRKSTDLPLYYAQKDKDVCTAELFIDRFEVAAQIARWILPEGQPNRYERTCREFYLLLRGNALKWWASLDNCLDFDKTDWIAVRTRFLESYARHYTPTSACTGLAEMKQKTGESVQDYFVRCNEIYDRIKEIRPAALQVWRGALPAGVANNANLNLGKVQGVKEMGLFFLHLLFVAGLREDIRTKTIEQNDPDLEAARVTAKRMELLLADKRQNPRIMNINKSNQDSDSETEELDEYSEEEYLDLTEDEIGQLNAIRQQKGKRPLRPRRGFQRDLKGITCHYCSKKGHYQKVCRKRIKEKGAMVFPNRVNKVEDSNTETKTEPPPSEPPTQSAMSISSYYNINSVKNLN
jgi:Retrotransposon gag protein